MASLEQNVINAACDFYDLNPSSRRQYPSGVELARAVEAYRNSPTVTTLEDRVIALEKQAGWHIHKEHTHIVGSSIER
jgi:hypothetical protein